MNVTPIVSTRSTDGAWFKKNPSRNFRLRSPAPGEVEEIMRRSHPALGYEIAAMGGTVTCPSPDHRWTVVVVKVDAKTILKMLTLRPVDMGDDPSEGGWSFLAVTLMNKAFITRMEA